MNTGVMMHCAVATLKPSVAVKAYAETKNNTVIYGMVYGTPVTQALEKSLNEDNLVGSPISLDAAWVKSTAYLPIGATYQGAPHDGSTAWDAPSCRDRVLRGGSWMDDADAIRVSSRESYEAAVRYPTHGFRLTRSK